MPKTVQVKSKAEDEQVPFTKKLNCWLDEDVVELGNTLLQCTDVKNKSKLVNEHLRLSFTLKIGQLITFKPTAAQLRRGNK